MLRRFSLSLALIAVLAGFSQAAPITLDDIQTWVGTGSNRAGFVIDWNNGTTTESLAWGYRWDGTATGEDMVRALAGANIGIYATFTSFGGLGNAILGMGFDLDRDGQFGVTPSLTFVNGVATIPDFNNADSNRAPSDSGDVYREDFNSGFWGYWFRPNPETAWDFNQVGIASRVLTNGTWDGFSFAPNFDGGPPSEPIPVAPVSTAVPEPASVVLLSIGTGLLIFRRRAYLVASIKAHLSRRA